MEDALLAQLENNTLDDGKQDLRSSSASTNPVMMRQGGRQTGPKGVIDDQKYQQQLDASKRRGQIADYNAKLLAKAPVTTTYLQDQQQQQQQQMELVLESKPKPAIEDENDSDDEEVLKAYREKRLAELKKMRNHSTRQEHRVFGTLQDIDVDDFVTSIDTEWRTVPVIVHLYDDSLENCRRLDDILQGLAHKYSLAKFIRVSGLDLEFDLIGSPAILGYKSGMLIANLVRLDDEVGAKYTAESVEDVLIRHDVLSDDDQYDIPSSRIENDDDDDDE
ncbi:thioredoxin-like protein [Chlamydoabsidia padenii]|nr:thioredoxin-like protein [Chlamydoabsidia padenii]